MDMIEQAIDAGTLCRQASSFLDSGRPGSARPLLAAARVLDARLPELILVEVRLALADRALDRAIEVLDAAVMDMPGHAGLWKSRGEIRNRVGDWEGAARDAAEAVTLDPADPEAKAILGDALLSLNLVKQSVACLREAVSVAPANASYRELLSRAYEGSGDAEAALHVLNEGIAAGHTHVSLFNAAILLNIRCRDFTQADELAEQARVGGIADACTFGLKGHALCSLGRHDEAALAYQEALKFAPDDPYVRHLAMAQGYGNGGVRAPAEFIRRAFDNYAERFETHLAALGYTIPEMICGVLQQHPAITAGSSLGPVLDLGCGTGLVAMALGELSVGPFTGVDISPNMLAQARAKRLYAELRQADIIADLQSHPAHWPLIIAADVMCYVGDLRDILDSVSCRLALDGWFIFSIELLLPDRDGIASGNGEWALQRQGRYVHAHDYIYEVVAAAGMRILQQKYCTIRREAGAEVSGLLLITAPVRQ